ncbi:uncharacterized protein METZ01_LOCUS235785, partial [marine metagenome]
MFIICNGFLAARIPWRSSFRPKNLHPTTHCFESLVMSWIARQVIDLVGVFREIEELLVRRPLI